MHCLHAQALEPDVLIPLSEVSSRHCLLVGDVRQLPPTVKSRHAIANNFSWSVMGRMQELRKQPALLLVEQYRMANDIQRWPNLRFYGGELLVSSATAWLGQHVPCAFCIVVAEPHCLHR